MLMDLNGLAEGAIREPSTNTDQHSCTEYQSFHQRFLQPNEQSDLHESLGWLQSSRSNSPMPAGPPQVSLMTSILDTFQRAVAEMQIGFLYPSGADKNL